MSDLEKIRKWLDFIGETCQEMRNEVRRSCLESPDCMAYYVSRWESDCHEKL